MELIDTRPRAVSRAGGAPMLALGLLCGRLGSLPAPDQCGRTGRLGIEEVRYCIFEDGTVYRCKRLQIMGSVEWVTR